MTSGPRHSSGKPSEPAPTIDPQLLITYRYLRMSLVAVLTMLAASVCFQWFFAGNHLPSISDYYWTPVHAVFIGALLALGVGMVILKPDNELEDIFLNIAGVLAPVVAFVPTPAPGTCYRRRGHVRAAGPGDHRRHQEQHPGSVVRGSDGARDHAVLHEAPEGEGAVPASGARSRRSLASSGS